MESICKELKCYDLFTVNPEGSSGGLCLMWKDEVTVTVLSSCTRWIDARITWQNRSFLFTGVYGDPVTSERDKVWEKFIDMGQNRDEPWIVMGDFNEIYNNEEKRGGKARAESSFLPFRSMLSRCGLLELPFKGNPLSWFGKRNGELIHCKLDRVVSNIDWFINYPSASSSYLPRIGSDHSPVLTRFKGEDRKKLGQFRYDPRWVDKEGFIEAVQLGWTETSLDSLDIIQNIRSCRSVLAQWKKSHVLNSQVLIRDLKYKVDELTHRDTFDWNEYDTLKLQLNKAYIEEEAYWKNKSRIQWLQGGDRNSKFFHAAVKQKRMQNQIRSLRDDNTGKIIYEDKEMGSLACSYFENLFASELRLTSLVRSSDMFMGVEPKVTAQQNTKLLQPVSDGEIKNAAFSMSPNKCASPDGFSGSFYQSQWSVVGPSVCALVREFMDSGTFDHRINETSICLIPKKHKPDTLKDFRPISLCNFVYKIISKLMASRLKQILPYIISETQAAFVEGRLISDNILLAQEILHSMKVNPELCASSVAIKTDMMKAFDRVEWQFLEDSLRVLGFHETWILRIIQCVTSVSFGVLINGQRYGNFSPSRGIRQGDPLSPFLFILCTEVLILRLNRTDPQSQFQGLQLAPAAPTLSHLLFADDSLFFSTIETDQLHLLRRILQDYEEASCQKVNLEKSSVIYGPKVSSDSKELVKSIMGISNEGGKGLYLGMPEAFLGSKTETLKFLEDRLKSRICSWKNKFLSQGGKEILIKSVAQALPAYVMSCYRLPQSLIVSLTAEFAKFWWRNQDTGSGIHWHSWDKLTRRKEDSGLNFRQLHGFNMTLLCKQYWRICTQPNTVLARTLKAKYFPRHSSAYHAKLGQRPSFGSRSIMESKELLSMGLKKELGNGSSIDLIHDPWLVEGLLRGARLLPHVSMPTISQLKDDDSDQWNISVLKEYFDEEECKRILQVKPGGQESQSTFSWIHNNTGMYSVKSGYWLWSNSHLNHSLAIEQKPNFSEIFKSVWTVNTSSKIRNFMWRILSSSLSVGSELFKKRITTDPSCKLCGYGREDSNHILFKCDLAKEIWDSSSLASLFPTGTSDSLHCNLWTCVTEASKRLTTGIDDVEDTQIGPWLLWLIWKARNESIFQQKTTSGVTILHKARTDAREWLQSNSHISPSLPRVEAHQITEKWVAPPLAFLKCNIDASWQDTHDRCGVSWILRDDTGRVRLYGIKVFPKLLSPLETEATAMVWAVQCIWNMGYDRVIFESDSSTPSRWQRLLPFTTEIQGIVSRRS